MQKSMDIRVYSNKQNEHTGKNIKKTLRYVIYVVVIVLAEIILRSLSLIDFLNKDILPAISFITGATLLLLYRNKSRTIENK